MDDLVKIYNLIVDDAFRRKQISKSCYESLKRQPPTDMDEMMLNGLALLHAIEHGEYYITLDRITKGEEMLAAETNEAKKSEYRKLLNELTVKLERLRPKEETA